MRSRILFIEVFMISLAIVFTAFVVWNRPVTDAPEITYKDETPYTFTERKDTVTITWVYDTDKVRAELDKVWDKEGAIGLAYPDGNNCIVYAFEPEYVDDRYNEILAHELLHCFRGAYHK